MTVNPYGNNGTGDAIIQTDWNNQPRLDTMPGFVVGEYSVTEAMIGLAVADATSLGGGGSGMSLSVADVTTAVNNSSVTTSLSSIDTLSADIVTNTQDIEDLLAELRDATLAVDANALVDFNSLATGVASSVKPFNASTVEVYLENKSTSDNVYIRNNGVPTTLLSITLRPGDSYIFSGYESTQEIQAITDGSNVNLYIKVTNAV